ncbi:MAG: DsbA family protein [Candidatus Riflebacteria bacterium]|nr:DsbA family protein [Candidatus Riflebacteria bacterium]
MNITFTSPDIKFYFSFQCPYCYIAWELLKAVLKNTRLTLQPLEIGLNPPGNTKFHFREIWGELRWKRLIDEAAAIKLTISKPDRYVSDIPAIRAIEAYGTLSAEDYITSVFRAVFSARVDISIPTSLRLHLQSEGLDSSILMAALDDPKTEKKASEQILLWGHERIRMLPTIECSDERFCGLVDKHGLERLFRSILE